MVKKDFSTPQKPVSIFQANGMVSVTLCLDQEIVADSSGRTVYRYSYHAFSDAEQHLDIMSVIHNPTSYLTYIPMKSRMY